MTRDKQDTAPARTKGPKLLRPEGRVLSWTQLTTDQRRVMERVLDALGQAVEQGSGKDRRSQVLFLHGARGTGKSSVIVSLIDAFKAKGAMPWGERDQEPERQEILRKLHELRDNVVWLDWIDMDPFPRSAHLMSAVLARIEQVAVKHRGRGPQGEMDDVLFRYRRVQIEAAEGWEGNVREKAATTDLEVYAGDVMRAERKKIELHENLERSLDEICERVLGNSKSLFVLPVDDFDLNPAHAVELIKLIRKLALPRLFTLVLGDIDVAAQVFYLSTRGELVQAGRLEARGMTNDIDVVAGESAAAAIRKLIPPEQVLKLDLLPLKAAPDLRPFEKKSTLGQLLDQVPVSLILPGYDPACGAPPAVGEAPQRDGDAGGVPTSRRGQHLSTRPPPVDTEQAERKPEWYRRSLRSFLLGPADVAPGQQDKLARQPHPNVNLPYPAFTRTSLAEVVPRRACGLETGPWARCACSTTCFSCRRSGPSRSS